MNSSSKRTIVTPKLQQYLSKSILNDLCNFLPDFLTACETHYSSGLCPKEYVPSGISSLPTISFPTSISPHTRAAAAPGSPFFSRIGSMSLVIAIAHLASAPFPHVFLTRVDLQGCCGGWFPDCRVSSCESYAEVPAEYSYLRRQPCLSRLIDWD